MNLPGLHTQHVYQAAKESIFENHVSKLLTSGGRIPSDRQLASELGINVGTVARALNELAVEGFLKRRVGSGTYVTPHDSNKLAVGIYFGGPVMDGRPINAIYGALDVELQKVLYDKKRPVLHYVDTRISEFQGRPLMDLVEDANHRKISSLIVVRANRINYHWIEKLTVPAVGFDVYYGHGWVGLDLYSFAEQAVHFLSSKGCREIGLISTVSAQNDSRELQSLPLHEGFYNSLHDTGSTTRSAWVFNDKDYYVNGKLSNDPVRFGYESFIALWRKPDRPQGLIVFSDVCALGVVRAAREWNVNLGRDIRMVAHGNRENIWPELVNFPHIVFSMKDVAVQLCEMAGQPKESNQKNSMLIKSTLVLPKSEAGEFSMKWGL